MSQAMEYVGYLSREIGARPAGTEEEQQALYKEQKQSQTIRKAAKVYPNDPCPCGSGKKYKKCCGKNK